jgi:hypothetical protein
MLTWGASTHELEFDLPGDALVVHPQLTATRAITIACGPEAVWPWIAQIGQGRGGFYSYDVIENLLGCDIHSARDIDPRWQDPSVGDEVSLAPNITLAVAIADPPHTFVLHGGLPAGGRPSPFDFSWAFVVATGQSGSTRLVVRERYRYLRWWTPILVEPTEAISFVMSQRMLRGIRDRAESTAAALFEPDVRRARALAYC